MTIKHQIVRYKHEHFHHFYLLKCFLAPFDINMQTFILLQTVLNGLKHEKINKNVHSCCESHALLLPLESHI